MFAQTDLRADTGGCWGLTGEIVTFKEFTVKKGREDDSEERMWH